MAQKKSDLLSALGTVFQIMKAIIDEVLDLGGNDEDVRKILKDPILCRKIAEIIMAVRSFIATTFKVTVDCSRTLEDMIAVGNYDWVNKNITQEHFQVLSQGKLEKEVVLFHYEKSMTSKEAISRMDKEGFQPAVIEDLLALGEAHPDLQKQFPILALGSVWRCNRDVPYLGWDGLRRYLNLDWSGRQWSVYCRFVAVRK